MLGTRVILLGMNQFPGESQNQNEAEVIAVANHEIPMFWLLLFAASDIQLIETQGVAQDALESTTTKNYPILIARKANALEQLIARKNVLTSAISNRDAQLMERWLTYIQHTEFPVLAMDTYELWNNMDDPAQLYPDLESLLNVLSHSLDDSGKTAEVAFDQIKQTGKWQANNSIALAGFGW